MSRIGFHFSQKDYIKISVHVKFEFHYFRIPNFITESIH